MEAQCDSAATWQLMDTSHARHALSYHTRVIRSLVLRHEVVVSVALHDDGTLLTPAEVPQSGHRLPPPPNEFQQRAALASSGLPTSFTSR
jgi:hypothetical protein